MLVKVLCVICLAGMLGFVAAAVMVRSTFKSAIALGAASTLLGLVMYLLGAGWAALFEISVCSGFVTVIFISAVTMTNNTRKAQDEIYGQSKDTWVLPMLMIGTGMLMLAVFAAVHFRLPYPTGAVAQQTLSGELWGSHRDLITALIAALIAGTFAVVVLFREEDDK
jgi:uncharacterized MnhB-related membrane protein